MVDEIERLKKIILTLKRENTRLREGVEASKIDKENEYFRGYDAGYRAATSVETVGR